MAGERKAQLEQRAVLILLVLFVVVLVGSLKSVGVFGRNTPPPQAPEELPNLSPVVHQQVQGGLELGSASEGAPLQLQVSGVPMPSVSYTALAARDPLVPMLPLVGGESGKPVDAGEEAEVQPVPVVDRTSTVSILGASPGPAALQGVIWGDGTPQAIINGEVYQLGDVLEQSQIVAINREGVTVRFQGRLYWMAVKDPNGPIGEGVWQPGSLPASLQALNSTPGG